MSRIILPYVEPEDEIPPRVYFIWIGKPMPDWARAFYEIWEQYCEAEDLELVLLGNEQLAGTLAERVWKKFPNMPIVQVSDLMRIEYVYLNGGMYMDADSMPVRSLREAGYVGKRNAWLGQGQPWVPGRADFNNATFGFPKGHGYLAAVWDHALDALRRGLVSTQKVTGPDAFKKVYYATQGQFALDVPHGPFYQYGKKDKWRELELGRMETADELIERLPEEVVVVHFSMQSWYVGQLSKLNQLRRKART